MLQWMQSFGVLRQVGVESTGTYGAGLLRYLQAAGVEVLEVTTPDKNTIAVVVVKTTTWAPRMRLMRRSRVGGS
jgi:transposase